MGKPTKKKGGGEVSHVWKDTWRQQLWLEVTFGGRSQSLNPDVTFWGLTRWHFFFFGGGGEGFSPQTPNLVDKTVRRRPTKNSPEAMSEKEILKRPTTKTVSPQAPEIFRSTKKSQQRHAHKDRRVTPVGFKTTVLGSDSPYFFLSCCCFVSFYDPKFRRILS